MFTGCGDGNTQEEHVVGTLEAQPILSSLEVEIVNMEDQVPQGRTDQRGISEHWQKITAKSAACRAQRVLLEQSYRLYDDTEAF